MIAIAINKEEAHFAHVGIANSNFFARQFLAGFQNLNVWPAGR
jgi:hypothetical protein